MEIRKDRKFKIENYSSEHCAYSMLLNRWIKKSKMATDALIKIYI
jgi:hypothetical protein